MLNIAFFDGCGWDYTPATPYVRPLGGSQSALCYLAAALAKRMHRVMFFGGMAQGSVVEGVGCYPLALKPQTILRSRFDAMIVLNGPADLGPQLKPCLHPDTPLVLWTQHAADQPAMQPLERESIRSSWDHIICVSDWHRRTMIERYGLDESRVSVRRNAIGPAFEGMFASREELIEAKKGPPVLAYTSTPFRGLDVLLDVFPSIRENVPDVTLKVYSSMKVYQVDGEDEYATLYDLCRATEGVEYVGSLPQTELAKELRSAHILAYPCTFAETSCIAVAEAMAAGLRVATIDIGALRETMREWGYCVPWAAGAVQPKWRLAGWVSSVALDWKARPGDLTEIKMMQVADMNEHCTWPVRAAEWEAAIPTWKHAETGASA